MHRCRPAGGTDQQSPRTRGRGARPRSTCRGRQHNNINLWGEMMRHLAMIRHMATSDVVLFCSPPAPVLRVSAMGTANEADADKLDQSQHEHSNERRNFDFIEHQQHRLTEYRSAYPSRSHKPRNTSGISIFHAQVAKRRFDENFDLQLMM